VIRSPGFVKQNVAGFGVAIEAKKCSHFFVNERRSQLAGDIPPYRPWNAPDLTGLAFLITTLSQDNIFLR